MSSRGAVPALVLACASCISMRTFLSCLGHVLWPALLQHMQPPTAARSGNLSSSDWHRIGVLLHSMLTAFVPYLAPAEWGRQRDDPSDWPSTGSTISGGMTNAPVGTPPVHGIASGPPGPVFRHRHSDGHALEEAHNGYVNAGVSAAAPDAAGVKGLKVAQDSNEENQGDDRTCRVATDVFA